MLVEVMVPVRSVTKGLVLALTTPAQVEMLARRSRTPLHVLEIRASDNRVRTVRCDQNHRFALSVPVPVLHTVNAVAQRARRTLANDFRDLRCLIAIRIDPRLLTQLEYGLEVVAACRRMRTDATVVEDRDAGADVLIAPVRDTIGVLRI